jgi:hypothetical protein
VLIRDITNVSRGKNSSRIGTVFRSITNGPEASLLARFLKFAPFEIPRGQRATIFREPRLESGFPDAVIVIWKPSVARHWSPRRRKLDTNDLRLMDFLFRAKSSSEKRLVALFGRSVLARLKKLAEAACVIHRTGKWRVRVRSSIFAATEIIAIEAKLGKHRHVLSQAQLNTWFASLSYVLTPKAEDSNGFLSEARRLGIGVWTFADRPRITVRPRRRELPRSYASWLFNEWVCSTAHRRKGV